MKLKQIQEARYASSDRKVSATYRYAIDNDVGMVEDPEHITFGLDGLTDKRIDKIVDWLTDNNIQDTDAELLIHEDEDNLGAIRVSDKYINHPGILDIIKKYGSYHKVLS